MSQQASKFIAQVTVPSEDNEGQSLAAVHSTFKRELCAAFGGYTSFETGGGWVDPATNELYEEDGTTYQVAIEATSNAVDLFRAMVLSVGRSAGQKAMFYVIDGFATVETLEA